LGGSFAPGGGKGLLGLNSSAKEKDLIVIKPPQKHREKEGFDNLPDFYKVADKDEFNEADNCEMVNCGANFKGIKGAKRHHCRRCAKSVCEKCSLKRRLSKTDAELHYTCTQCDFKLTNSHFQKYTTDINNDRDLLINQISEIMLRADPEIRDLQAKVQELTAQIKAEEEQFSSWKQTETKAIE
jgi:hypothetical protein